MKDCYQMWQYVVRHFNHQFLLVDKVQLCMYGTNRALLLQKLKGVAQIIVR